MWSGSAATGRRCPRSSPGTWSRWSTRRSACSRTGSRVNAETRPPWWKSWKVMVPLWIAIAGLTWWALESRVDVSVIAGSVVVVGLVTNAFAWLLGLVALVPVVGPLIVTALTTGFVLLLNAVGSIVSFIAIRRGYSKDVLTYRGLTVAVIIGIVIG